MNLTLLTPSRIHCRAVEVTYLRAVGLEGVFGLLPRHLDYVAALRPGILIFDDAQGRHHLAVDEGVLVKEGGEVRVVSLRVVEGPLEELPAAVRAMLDQTEQHERKTRAALASLEAGLVRHFANLESSRGR